MGTAKIQVVRASQEAGIARVKLCRSDRYNAIDAATLHALLEFLNEPHPDTKVLVLEGDGAMFSVGPDIAELVTLDGERALAFSQLGHEVMGALERWPGVTIARLTGYALGSGLELALGCDVLIGTSDLRIGLPGLAWALVPCMGGLRRLAYRVSQNLCSDLFLNGEVLSAERALSIGLLDRIVNEPSELEYIFQQMTEYSPQAVTAIRDVRLQRQGPIQSEAEAKIFAQVFANGECQKRLRELLASG
jgi:enoyl-CoA hydratase